MHLVDMLAELAAMKIWAKKAAAEYQGDSRAYGSGYLAAVEHLETWLAVKANMPWTRGPQSGPGNIIPAGGLT